MLWNPSQLFGDFFTMKKANVLSYKIHKIWIPSITELHVPFLWRAAVQQQIQHLHIEDTPDQLVPWWMLYQDCSMVENLRSLPPYTQQECQHQIKTIMWLLLLVFGPWASLGRDQSSVRRLVWLWYAASWASS